MQYAQIICLTRTHYSRLDFSLSILPGFSGCLIGGRQMALVRWSPVSQLAGMEIDRLNRMFNELYQDIQPRLDAGGRHLRDRRARGRDQGGAARLKREDISVTFENNVLTLKGERKLEQEVKREQLPADRAPARQFQPVVHASDDCRCQPDHRRLQGRRADDPAAAARGSQAKQIAISAELTPVSTTSATRE